MPTIIDGTAGITFPNSTVQASAGSVLQVVNGVTATGASNSTNTYTDTNLTLAITPKFATSKILIIANIAGAEKNTSNTYHQFRLVRNSTSILICDQQLGYTASSAVNSTSFGVNYLDSPATTSATTYKVQFASGNNTAAVAVQASSSNSTITLMEIAG